MKKSIIFLAVGTMAFTACTSTDVVDESIQTNAIGFQNVVSKESRAIDTEHFGNFFVYGYYTFTKDGKTSIVNVFNDQLVSKSGTTWGYENPRYWVPGANYFFYAYSCDNQKDIVNNNPTFNISGSSPEERVLTLQDYRCDNTHMHDLVYAFNEGTSNSGILGKESQNALVSFNFSHVLSRVRVTFKSEFDPQYKLVVSDVAINNIRNIGDYNPKNTTPWGNVVRTPGDATPYINLAIQNANNTATALIPATEEGAEDIAAVNATTDAGYVIPFNYKEITAESGTTQETVVLTFTVAVKDMADNTIITRTITGSWSPNWQSGKSYNYNVSILGQNAGLEEIKFEASQTIGGWSNSTGADVNESNEDISIDMSFNQTTPETPAE